MFELYEPVINQYPIKVNNCYKGRGAVILDTDNGKKLLKEVQLPNEKLSFLSDLLLFLKSEGFYVDQLNPSKTGDLFVEEDSKKYILKDYTEGRELMVHAPEEIFAAVTWLGKFHLANQKFVASMDISPFDKTDQLLTLFLRHNQELIRIKNGIKKQGKWSEFELLFLEYFEIYYKQAQTAVAEIEKIHPSILRKYDEHKIVIHGQYNHHNLIFDDLGRLHIQNFEYASYNYPVIDLAGILRKTMEKNDWDIPLGLHILDTYQRVYPLDQTERELLLWLFVYPEKFWKISNYYFNQNKAWKPKQTWVKLKKLVAAEPKRQCFIVKLKQSII